MADFNIVGVVFTILSEGKSVKNSSFEMKFISRK